MRTKVVVQQEPLLTLYLLEDLLAEQDAEPPFLLRQWLHCC